MDWDAAIPKPGRYAPDGRTPAQAMAAIRYAADGTHRFIQVGDENGIQGFDDTDLAAIAGGLFVHNHPPYTFPAGDPRRPAGSFSPKDLVFMWEYVLAEMVAVTAERTYAIRRPPGGFLLDPGQIRKEYEADSDRIGRRLRQMARQGKNSAEESLSDGRLADDVLQWIGL
jgi:hypothetical protein